MLSYTTTQGDMWDLIAYKTLGSERYMSIIIEANEQYIDTVVFKEGITLSVPQGNTSVSRRLPPWVI